MNDTPTTTPRDKAFRAAATVILLDTIGGEPAALMVRRNPALKFFGGYWVFPGGAIDAADGLSQPDAIRAAAVAGSRELHEEAGLGIDPAGFVYWERWITPSSEPKRFDTHFFLAAADPRQQPRITESEVIAYDWLPLARWASLSESGTFPVPAPTQLVLRGVAEAIERHGSVEELLARERHRTIDAILPKMLEDDTIVLPWDPEYASVPGEGRLWGPAARAARRQWPSRFR